MSLNVNHWLVSEELRQMRRYLNLLHTAISDRQKQLDASIKNVASTMSEDEKEEFYDSYEDEFIEAGADFPRLLFSSFVVSWYSFIENHLINFCRSQELSISISIQDNENYGEGIRRAYNFLNRAAGYQIENIHWQELIRIGKTRNRIVHNGGRLPSSHFNMPNHGIPVRVNDSRAIPIKHDEVTLYLQIEEDLYHYLQTHQLLEYSGSFQITPTYEYCEHLVKFGLKFFDKLYKDFGKEPKTQHRRAKGG
jgi:hypothetical protein